MSSHATERVDIVPIPDGQQDVLLRLWELYVYDFSELDGRDVGEDGRFGSARDLGEYWRDPRRHPYVVRVDGKLAGFVLAHRHGLVFDDPDVTRMSEFFVMRKFRRRGVGERAATLAFDLFPGRWEVWEIAQNVAAQAFWRRVIGRYTGGRFEERTIGERPVQLFDTRDRVSAASAASTP